MTIAEMSGRFSGHNAATWFSAILIFVYTIISNSTFTVSLFALPYMLQCFQTFPDLSLVSGLVSAAKVTSSILVFVFPDHPIHIMVVFAVKAIIVATLSEQYSWLEPDMQGTWVAILLVFLAFSCGSTVARALTIRESPTETHFLSNAYTLGKQCVHMVELIATSALFDRYCWDGVAIWVIVCYVIVAVISAGILCSKRHREQYGKKEGYGAIGGDMFHKDSDHSSVSSGVSSVTASFDQSSQHSPSNQSRASLEQEKPALVDKSTVSVWRDMVSVPVSAWLLIVCTEMAQFLIGVISLAAVMLIKDRWNMAPRAAAMIIFLPQIIVIPVFFLTTLLNLNCYITVTLSLLVSSIVAFVPFVPSPVYISVIVFTCELANAMRLSGQMPCFAHLVNEPRISKRFVTVSTLLSFSFRTVGLSLGSHLYSHWYVESPFIIAAGVQVVGSFIVACIYYVNYSTIRASVQDRLAKLNERSALLTAPKV
jgi:hypothetical protein